MLLKVFRRSKRNGVCFKDERSTFFENNSENSIFIIFHVLVISHLLSPTSNLVDCSVPYVLSFLSHGCLSFTNNYPNWAASFVQDKVTATRMDYRKIKYERAGGTRPTRPSKQELSKSLQDVCFQHNRLFVETPNTGRHKVAHQCNFATLRKEFVF